MNGIPIEPNDGKHVCPHPTCEIRVDHDKLGCSAHWFKLPRRLRNEVWRAWSDGDMAVYAEVRLRAVAYWTENP